MVYSGSRTMFLQAQKRLFGRHLSAHKFRLRLFHLSIPATLAALIIMLSVNILGDSFIADAPRPECESYRQQLEIVIGGE